MRSRLAAAGLWATLFLAGAAVLVLEVAAMRMFAPWFGSTGATTSSVLGTVLGALSIGYVAGGKLADRMPRMEIFYGLICLSGLAILLEHQLAALLLPSYGLRMSILWGPLVCSAAILLVPSALLGMTSPFALRLLSSGRLGVGTLAGRVFFWGTLGSIAGSLAAGYLLLPQYGQDAVLGATGLALVLAGAIGWMAFAPARRPVALGAAALAAFLATTAMALPVPPASADARTLEVVHGKYGTVAVQDVATSAGTLRLLVQDRAPSSGLLLPSGEMAFPYLRHAELFRLSAAEPRHALVMGAGAYMVPRFLLAHTQAVVDVAEIEPALLPLAHRHFDVPRDARLRDHLIDGRRFLAQGAARYDLVFVDVYSAMGSVPPQFSSREFFQLVAAKLSPGGLMILNHFGSLDPATRPMLVSMVRTISEAFPAVRVFAVNDPHSLGPQNFIIAAWSGSVPDMPPSSSVRFHHAELSRVDASEIRFAKAEIASAPVWTDAHAPVDAYAPALLGMVDRLLRSPVP